jgi:hypothetical protein
MEISEGKMNQTNTLIQRLTNAIFRQEGMPADHHNPGNLRSAPWIKNPIIARGFWQPTSRAEGVAGAAHCVALRISKGQSLVQLISAWAPPSDNNDTTAYIAHVKEWAAIPDENAPLYNFLLD